MAQMRQIQQMVGLQTLSIQRNVKDSNNWDGYQKNKLFQRYLMKRLTTNNLFKQKIDCNCKQNLFIDLDFSKQLFDPELFMQVSYLRIIIRSAEMLKQNPEFLEMQQSTNDPTIELTESRVNRFSNYQAQRSERISKLQQLLKKNDNVRHPSKKNQSFVRFNLSHPRESNRKLSLPTIKIRAHNEDLLIVRDKSEYPSTKATTIKQAQKDPFFDKSFGSMDYVIGTDHSDKNGHEMSIITNQEYGQKKKNKSFLKLKVKVMSFESNNDYFTQSIEDSRQKCLENSLKIEKTVQKLSVREMSDERQEKENIRRRRRDICSLKLGKIELLPQILFMRSKKCQRFKFPSSTMADIDNKLLSDQIIELEKKCLMEKRARQKNQVMFKTRMKNHYSLDRLQL